MKIYKIRIVDSKKTKDAFYANPYDAPADEFEEAFEDYECRRREDLLKEMREVRSSPSIAKIKDIVEDTLSFLPRLKTPLYGDKTFGVGKELAAYLEKYASPHNFSDADDRRRFDEFVSDMKRCLDADDVIDTLNVYLTSYNLKPITYID